MKGTIIKVLDLFAGSCSFSNVAKELGHETFTVDNGLDLFTVDHYSKIDLVEDILNVSSKDIPWKPDFIWASPPCTTFSISSCMHHWTKPEEDGTRYPKSEKSKLGLQLLEKTLSLIVELEPSFYAIENPRGLMRKMPIMESWRRHTVTYCQYGDNRMKPTDIWTNAPWTPRPMCKNGDSCHKAAPRGSTTGTQGMQNSYEKSKVPYELCKEILTSIKI